MEIKCRDDIVRNLEETIKSADKAVNYLESLCRNIPNNFSIQEKCNYTNKLIDDIESFDRFKQNAIIILNEAKTLALTFLINCIIINGTFSKLVERQGRKATVSKRNSYDRPAASFWVQPVFCLWGDFLNKVLREEKKFLISVADFIGLSHKVEQIMLGDPHNGTHGYMIRSLYFDTPFDDDYYEKQAGVELRRKVRLRCYDPNSDFAMLELKQKQGVQQLKRSLRVSKADAQRLIAGDYAVLLSYEETFATEMYALMQSRCYRPKTIVEYNRKAFIAKENKIRITFDNKIVSTESSFELFDPNLNMNPVLDPYDVVLEVKFNGFLLTYIKELINCTDKSELSVSKYVLARQNAYQTHI